LGTATPIANPIAHETGKYGPIDVEDYRGVMNAYNLMEKILGKRNPYSGYTYKRGFDMVPKPWNENDDFMVNFLADGVRRVIIGINSISYCTTNDSVNVAIGIDSRSAISKKSGISDITGGNAFLEISADWRDIPTEGIHYAVPLGWGLANGTWTELSYYYLDQSQIFVAMVMGLVWC